MLVFYAPTVIMVDGPINIST